MPRGYTNTSSPLQEPEAGSDWQALRGELVGLLDAVEDTYAKADRTDPRYAVLSQRVKELRDQVGGAAPDTRHREALKSVQRAVDRFTDRDGEPQEARDQLSAAIYEIRARQGVRPEAPKAAAPLDPVPRFPQHMLAQAGAPAAAPPAPRPAAEDVHSATRERLRHAEEEARNATIEAVRRAAEDEARKSGEATVRRAEEAATRAAEAMAQKTAETIVQRAAETTAQRAAELTAQRTAELVAQRTAEAVLKRTSETSEAHRLATAAHFDELAGSVSALTSRLEGLDAVVKQQSGGTQATVRDIADQVGQLSHVVELLAGAVGETGQVRRLESQIAELSKLVTSAPKVDLSALTSRLDELSVSLARMDEARSEQAQRLAAEAPAQREIVRSGMAAIETSVRNIYDRIDAVEKAYALPQAEIERLTGALSAFTDAMSRNEDQPTRLVPLIDALNSRIGEIEVKDSTVNALRDDISSLRDTVMAAVEPRFAAIEDRIEALADKVVSAANRPVPAPDTAALEAQLRLMRERMDETGSQLSGLAQLYADADQRGSGPDYDRIAELVASRTSEALASALPAPAGTNVTGETLDEFERRMARLFKTSQSAAPLALPAELDGMQDGIRAVDERLARLESALYDMSRTDSPAPSFEVGAVETGMRKVDARLEKLETAISGLSRPAAPAPVVEPDYDRIAELVARRTSEAVSRSVTPVAPARAEAPAAPLMAEAAPVEAPRQPRGRSDQMPASPALDQPIPDRLTSAPPIIPLVAEAKPASKPAAFYSGAAAQEKVVPPPHFDPSRIEKPARPESSLAPADKESFAPIPTRAPDAPAATEAPASAASRNTFIEAARRAAQRQGQPAAKDAGANSLIGRALARFQPDGEKAAAPAPLAAEKPAKPAKAEKPKKAPKPTRAEKLAAARTAAVLPDSPDAESLVAAAIGPKPEPKQSFLLRHRQPILLAASVVAIALLALNFIGQRMAAPQPEVIEPAAELAPEPEVPAVPATTGAVAPTMMETAPAEEVAPVPVVAEAAAQPRVIPITDGLTVGAIGPTNAALGLVPTQGIPAPLTADPGAAAADADVAAIAPGDTATGPATFELPPEALGPIELRQAAADGDARAQFEIAAIYTEGAVIGQDYAAAAIWYERSAAQGFAPAQYRLGSLYEAGKGVEKNADMAKLWYLRAAEAGNRMAMHNLAALYASGALGDQQFEPAAQWFEQAGRLGMTDSQFNLGMLYARGLGVTQSLEESYKWFSIAALNGDPDAIKARDDVAKSLDAATVAKVGSEVAGWAVQPIDLASNFAPIGTWSTNFDPGVVIENRDVIRKVQIALTRLGYSVGTPDGVAGPRTAEAIRSFERTTGMSESGKINPRLLAVLGSQPV